jgi:hypothetical protein
LWFFDKKSAVRLGERGDANLRVEDAATETLIESTESAVLPADQKSDRKLPKGADLYSYTAV